ncbi:type II toxin-antitoxin system RelE/ParE family toxin [Candidatus Gottesmanbacteria bacterium]|nr:type II toxin-antitoxin system RelE/ParE family toxin [Candidatus Gottesmanbacteria bacterium]
MKITILPRAEKELRKIPKFDQIAIAVKIRSLASPSLTGEEKLSGFFHVYRIRVGHYRVVYKKEGDEITVVLIRHRKDVYRMLATMLG